MYRTLLLLVYAGSTIAAPQDSSDITYVKIRPLTDPEPKTQSGRESRIENVPLTIPGNVRNRLSSAEVVTKDLIGSPSRIDSPEDVTGNIQQNKSQSQANDGSPRFESSDHLPERVSDNLNVDLNQEDINTEIDETNVEKSARNENQQDDGTSETSSPLEENISGNISDLSEDVSGNLSEGQDSSLPDPSRRVRSEDVTESYETETTEPTDVTERDEILEQTDEYESQSKAPPARFLSKLSYFKKQNEIKSSIATNLIERPYRRKFRSKCRCELISNCPKLQISVPRCPNDYFLCCF